MVKLIYIHSRKTAGKSVIQFFEDIGYDLKMVSSLNLVNDNYVTIGTIRNPYDRAISGWKYCGTTKFKSLLEALENPPQKDDYAIEYWLGRGHDYRHFTKTQTQSYVCGNKKVDILVRVEHLQEDLEKLCCDLGIETKGVKVGTVHRGKYEPYDLSDEEKEAIYRNYEDDFLNFGYEK